MKNKIPDVRNHLVAMMERLGDGDASTEDIARARAMSELSKAYVDTVRVEIDARRMAESHELPDVIPQSKPAGRLIEGGK